MGKPRTDWDHWYRVWGEVSTTTGMTLRAFCDREGLPLENARKAFSRRNKAAGEPGRKPRKDATAKWESLRIEFLECDFKTLADFARAKGLNAKTGYFAKKTAGWLKEKAEIEEKSRAESVAVIADGKGVEAIARLHGRVLTALYSCLGDLEENGEKRVSIHKEIESAKDNSDFLRGVNTAIDGLLKLVPSISRIEGMVGARDLLRRLAEQDIDVSQAALAFEEMGVSLPETVKILLSKEVPPEPPEPENEFPSDEELDALYEAGIASIDEETEKFLPERQKEIEGLKRDLKNHDSFTNGGE